MSPLLGSIGGISEYNYRGTLDDWPNPFAFGSLTNIIPGTIVGISTVITGINYKASVSASGNTQISVRNPIGITSIYSGDSNTPSNTVTVSIAKSTTELNVGTNIRISNASDVAYNGEFLINSVIDSPYVTQFTYIVPEIPSTARPGITTASFDHQVYPFVTAELVYIRNDQILEVKIPTTTGSELDFDKQYRTTVRVGKRYASWSIRTIAKDNTPDLFIFNDVSGLNIGIATTSNSITISGLESGFSSYARISSGIGSFSVNGSVGLSTANVTNGDLIYMNEISSENYFTPKTSFLTVGTYTTSFTVTTRSADVIPDQFYFNSLVNVPINQDQVSISTSLTGTDNNIPLTALVSAPGTLKVNSDAYISGSTEVFNGDTVTLKIPANVLNSYQTTYSTQLTVSGISSIFSVTTRPRPIKTFPDQFRFADLSGVAPSTYVESSVVTLTGMTVGIADTGLATISAGSEFKVTRNGSLIREYNTASFPVKNSDQIQLKILSAGEGSSFQSTFTISGVDTTNDINGINEFTSDIWDVSSRVLSCKINETSFRAALVSVVNAKIRELKSISFTVSGLDNGCDTIITTSNVDSYIRNQNGIQVSSLQPLDIKNGDVISIYMTAASTYSTNKVTTIETKRRDGSDLISGTWTIGTQVEDKLPDSFNLPTRNQNNISPCTFRSTFVTESLSGLSQETVVAATVASTNSTAQISKNNGVFGTSISGGVKNGDRIDVRLKSNCNYGGPCEIATVTVGERTEQWTICSETIPLPTVTLSSNATNIQYNGSVTLTWTSTFATSVTSSSGTGFVGIGATQGIITIPSLKANSTYSITVNNSKGSATSTINVTVAAEPAPTVTLTARNDTTIAPIYTEVPEGIYANGKYIFISGYERYEYLNQIIEGKSFIHISSDGLSWDIISPNINDLLRDICYDDSSTFVAVGNRGTILRTTDNWQTITNHSIVPAGDFVSVTYGNGKYAAILNNRITYTSTNGLNWSIQNTNIPNLSNVYSSSKIRFLNGFFYLLSYWGSGNIVKIHRSSDLIIWNEVCSFTINNPGLFDIIYTGNEFIAVGVSSPPPGPQQKMTGLILRSVNGNDWSIVLQPPSTVYHLATSGSVIIAAGGDGPAAGGLHYTSTNGGISWTQRNIQTTPNYINNSEGGQIIFGGNKFVSMMTQPSNHNFLYKTTSDGISWNFSSFSVKYRIIDGTDPSNSSFTATNSPSDSLGRYYSVQYTGGSSSWTTSFRTISNISGFYNILTRNSNGSLVKTTSIYLGSSNLTWASSTNATSVVSTSGAGFSTSLLSGSTTVRPTQTTEYSITVQNSSSVSATAKTTIYISTPTPTPAPTPTPTPTPTPPPAPTVILSSSSPSINPSGSITLSWTSTNATSVTGYSGFGFIPTSTSGSLTINNITQNTSYNIKVTGPGGTVTSNTINVTLNSSNITLTASPTTVNYGGSTTLTWSSTNATSVLSSNFGASSVGGSLVVTNLTTPGSSSSTETYTITVTGPGGSSTASSNVTVLPPKTTASLTANPTLVPYGGSTILTWTSANATTLTSNFGETSLNGSTTITNVIANKRYTITVSSASGAIATSFVDIVAGSPPPTVNLCATNIGDGLLPILQDCGPTKLVGYGAQVRLEWSSTNATSVLSTSGQSFSGITATNGSFILPYSFKTPGTYSITVSGSGGTATDSIVITPTECNGNTYEDNFVRYKNAYANYTNGTTANPPPYTGGSFLLLFTSTKTTASLPGRPNYSYALIHEFIYDSYRTIVNRSPEKEGLEFYINSFITNKSTYRTLSELYSLINTNAAPELSDRASRGGLKSITDTCDKIWDTSTPLPAPTRCTSTLITDGASNANYRNGFIVLGNGVDQTILPFFVSTINPSLALPNRPTFTYGQVHSYIKSVYNAPTTSTSGLSRPPEKDGFLYYVNEFQIKLSDGTYKYNSLTDLGVKMNELRTDELNTRNLNGGFVATVDTCGKIWSY